MTMRQGAAENRSSRRIVIAFLLACVALLVVGPRVEPVAGVLSPVFVPVQSVVAGVTDDVTGAVSSLTNLPSLQRQVNQLRKQNAILDQRLAKYPIYVRENRALSRELNFRDLNPHLALQPARVIGGSLLGLGDSVEVNAGTDEGVRVGNPVVDPNGFVVGKVTGAFQADATVGLLTAQNINIPAMDSRTGAMGVVGTPYGESPSLQNVLVGRRLRAGDLVVTSGLGNEFPIGSLIGQITAVHGSSVQAFQSASLHTAANLNNLEYVQIIRNFGPGARLTYRPSVRRLGLR